MLFQIELEMDGKEPDEIEKDLEDQLDKITEQLANLENSEPVTDAERAAIQVSKDKLREQGAHLRNLQNVFVEAKDSADQVDGGKIDLTRFRETLVNINSGQTSRASSPLRRTGNDGGRRKGFMNNGQQKMLNGLSKLKGMNPAMLGQNGMIEHPGLSKDQKRALLTEFKTEVREMTNSISQHYSDEATKRLDKKLDAQDHRIKREIRGKFDEFNSQMIVVTEYCKKQLQKIQADF